MKYMLIFHDVGRFIKETIEPPKVFTSLEEAHQYVRRFGCDVEGENIFYDSMEVAFIKEV